MKEDQDRQDFQISSSRDNDEQVFATSDHEHRHNGDNMGQAQFVEENKTDQRQTENADDGQGTKPSPRSHHSQENLIKERLLDFTRPLMESDLSEDQFSNKQPDDEAQKQQNEEDQSDKRDSSSFPIQEQSQPVEQFNDVDKEVVENYSPGEIEEVEGSNEQNQEYDQEEYQEYEEEGLPILPNSSKSIEREDRFVIDDEAGEMGEVPFYVLSSLQVIRDNEKEVKFGRRLMDNMIRCFRDKFCKTAPEGEQQELSPPIARYYQEFVELLFNLAENPQNLTTYLQGSSKLYSMFGTYKDNFQTTGECILEALQWILEEQYTVEVKEQWSLWLQYIMKVMIYLNDKSSNFPQEFTDHNIAIIQDHIETIKQAQNFSIYENLLYISPEAEEDFEVSDLNEQQKKKFFKKVQSKVIKAITHLMCSLHNWEEQQPLLQKLGEFHTIKKISYERYEQFGDAFVDSVIEALGENGTPEIETAFRDVFQGICSQLLVDFFIPGHEQEYIDDHQDYSTFQPIQEKDPEDSPAGKTVPQTSKVNPLTPERVVEEVTEEGRQQESDIASALQQEKEQIQDAASDKGVEADKEYFEQNGVPQKKSQSQHQTQDQMVDDFQEMINNPQSMKIKETPQNGSSSEQVDHPTSPSYDHVSEIEPKGTIDNGALTQDQLKRIVEEHDKQAQASDDQVTRKTSKGENTRSRAKKKEETQDHDNAIEMSEIKLLNVGSKEQIQSQSTSKSPNFNQHDPSKSREFSEKDTSAVQPSVQSSQVPQRARSKPDPRIENSYVFDDEDKDSPKERLEDQSSLYLNDSSYNLNPPTKRAPTKRNMSGLGDIDQEMDKLTPEQEAQIQMDLVNKMKHEVDFHHKIAYRFEKAYRLSKLSNAQPEQLTQSKVEILDCIKEFSNFLEFDPSAFFYCLFFCVYYKNFGMIEFFRSLIQKANLIDERTDKLLEYIDIYGPDRIRFVGEQINSLVYHMVFYRAVDDNLRVIYSSILRQLKFIQLRDKDAVHFINTRDFDLIDKMIGKYSKKINLKQWYSTKQSCKSTAYRNYSRAYFEEIVINNDVDERAAFLFRDRFLKKPEDFYNVLEMYCKEDYDQQFLRTKKDHVTSKQFIDLFVICLKCDSFKIAMLIYLNHIEPEVDIDEKMINIILSTVRDSCKFLEMKLFMIHEHFYKFTIQQMDNLLDIFLNGLAKQNFEENPMVWQFNTIKVSLLIYRVCWLIEEKQIYSLVTKCSILKNYLTNGLNRYLSLQTNILLLKKFMTEPILSLTERKDSLDIMQEMNMKELLQQPVIVDVINLIYEGEYSITSSALGLSRTFHCALEMQTFKQNSIIRRIVQNVTYCGGKQGKKQSSLMYYVWRDCISQRERDEMILTLLINFAVLALIAWMNQVHNLMVKLEKETFEGDVLSGSTYDRLPLLPLAAGIKFCQVQREICNDEGMFFTYYQGFNYLIALGAGTTVFQIFVNLRFRDNVTLDSVNLALQCILAYLGATIIYCMNWQYGKNEMNDRLANYCKDIIPMTDSDKKAMTLSQTIRFDKEGSYVSYDLGTTCIIGILAIQMLNTLQRTQATGKSITVLIFMSFEFGHFALTFGIGYFIFTILWKFLSEEMTEVDITWWKVITKQFAGFNRQPFVSMFKTPLGLAYSAGFLVIFTIFLFSFLIAMFINQHMTVSKNLDAIQRIKAIRLKNSASYHKIFGAISATFFPINLLLLPFAGPLMLFKNPRMSEFALKCQYWVMMSFYLLLSLLGSFPMIAFLYVKMIVNSVYIFNKTHKEAYKGQMMKQIALTVFLGLPLIIISLVVDVFYVIFILMMPANELEHKYQMYQETMKHTQTLLVIGDFQRIQKKYDGQLKGVRMTSEQLMRIHRKEFKIIENLHDLICRGMKDYIAAFSIILDYNMTKILTKQFSIPPDSGLSREAVCGFEQLFTVQWDIQMYNFVDQLIRLNKLGILRFQIKKGSLETDRKLDDIDLYLEQEKQDKENGLLPTQMGPDGALMWRNHSDFLNNIHIDKVYTAFVNTQREQQQNQHKLNKNRVVEMGNVVEGFKEEWREIARGEFRKTMAKFLDLAEYAIDQAQESKDLLEERRRKIQERHDKIVREVSDEDSNQ